jgi:hypothetical protein
MVNPHISFYNGFKKITVAFFVSKLKTLFISNVTILMKLILICRYS